MPPSTPIRKGEVAMRLLIAGSFLLAIVSASHAQSLDAPTYAVGDAWTYKTGGDTREIKVLRVDGGGGLEVIGYLPSCVTCIFQLDRNLTILAVLDAGGKPVDVTSLGFVPLGGSWQFFSFPLELKKRWDFTATAFNRGVTETYELTNRVETLEDVKTPAGTFKAYRVVRDWVLKARAQVRNRDITWRTTSWFAPDVKWVVKTTSTNPTGQDGELISYSLKK
jgi:hypothetical protein